LFRVGSVIAIFGILVAAPGAAIAVGAPTATTGAASAIGSTSATLNGTVSPNKQSTTVSFQYGTTTAYGGTASAGTINGNAAKSVSATISGLTPKTLYHFRVTATNASGQSVGQDMTFTTTASGTPPTTKNAVDIAAAPGAVTFGGSTVISGKVTGPKAGGVQVVLQQQAYPYTTPFRPTGAVTTTGSNGHYAFRVSPRTRTHYRVVAKTSPAVTSATVTVGVRYAVSFFVSSRFVHRGALVRFSGSVRPAANGRTVFIQRLSSTGVYRTVAKAVLHATTSSTRSSYSKRLRIFRTGVYRVRIRAHLPYSASNSRSRKITVV
jgi:molybdopterin synthase catalytic subunit